MNNSNFIAFAMLLLLSSQCLASPWISPGDLRMRHSLQVMNDHRVIAMPMSTWPIMWSGVIREVEGSEQSGPGQAMSYVQHEQSFQAAKGVNTSWTIGRVSESPLIRGFADQPREEVDAKLSIEYVGDRLAANLSVAATSNPDDDETLRADGSYLAANTGNWVMGVGALDRWWGNGWQSSLVLSSNARPIPSVWLNRADSQASSHWLLSWMGPWQLTLLAGQLESERVIPNAKLLGARLTFMPIAGLEVGLSRTLQWGGDGRPQNLSSLGDALIGSDNAELGQSGSDASNQLGGFDVRYGFALSESAALGVYAQFYGEDESGAAPSKYLGLFGIEASTHLGRGSQRWYLEGTNTVTGGFYQDERQALAYYHTTYETGYYYRGRNIASTFGPDSRALSLGFLHFFPDGRNLAVSLSNIEFQVGNVSDLRFTAPNVLPANVLQRQQIQRAEVLFEFPKFGGWVTASVAYNSEDVALLRSEQSSWQGSAKYEYEF